jgi:hypothetical protein
MIKCPWKENAVDNDLKGLMENLGNAINDSIEESDRIAEAIGEIKLAGYEVFIVLEATVGFRTRKDLGDDSEYSDISQNEAERRPEPPSGEPQKIKFTTQDYRFLDKLKIADPDKKS